jgi:hypothetical protein
MTTLREEVAAIETARAALPNDSHLGALCDITVQRLLDFAEGGVHTIDAASRTRPVRRDPELRESTTAAKRSGVGSTAGPASPAA